MAGLYDRALPQDSEGRRTTAFVLAAISVGGMVLARTLPDSELAGEVRDAGLTKALRMLAPAPS